MVLDKKPSRSVEVQDVEPTYDGLRSFENETRQNKSHDDPEVKP